LKDLREDLTVQVRKVVEVAEVHLTLVALAEAVVLVVIELQALLL
jgi:hypothetical protein